MKSKHFFIIIFTGSSLILSSCGFNFSSNDNQLFQKKNNVISGVISPFLGSITHNINSTLLFSNLNAATCADPVYARLYKIEADGSISDANPIASELVGPDARYSFDYKKLNILNENINVNYIVKAFGCNGDIYKRPITNFNSDQDIDAKTSVIADVVNTNGLVINKLNAVSKEDVQLLINSMENTKASTAIDSLISSASNSAKFMQIFGSSASIIQNAIPEVILSKPGTTINELTNSVFKISAFHSDPSYSFAYSWKLDGQVVTTNATFNYIPAANDSGNHEIDVYVGKKNNTGKIDLTVPYFTKRIVINVNNNILPTPPVVSINASTPSPRRVNNILVNLATGISFVNCASFSRLAVTETITPPGIMQFNINCSVAGTQTEFINYGTEEGNKNLYFWAIDNEGVISTPSKISLFVDTISPLVSLGLPSSIIKGGSTVSLNYSVIDANSISSVDLFYAADGVTFGAPYSLPIGSTSTAWIANSNDVNTAKLKITATDIAGNVGSVITNAFTIDSTAPMAPALTRSSRGISNSAEVKMTVGSCVDTSSILITKTNIKPSAETVGWQICSTVVGSTTTMINGEGVHTLYAWAKDSAGNIATSANSIDVILDTTPPILAVTTPYSMRGNVNTGSLSWTLTEANVTTGSVFNIEIFDGTSWSSVGTKAATIGANVGLTYTLSNFTIPNINSTQALMRVTFVDAAENSAIKATNEFIIDSSPPTVSSFSLNNGGTTTINSTLAVNLSATSTQGPAKITHFCLKYNNSLKPDLNDSCWISLTRPEVNITPATTINILNFNFPLGFSPGSYSVHGWVKDEVGQISNSQNAEMTLIQATPPVITNIIVSREDNPSMPLTYANTSFPLNSNVYINWKIEDTNGLQANSVNLEYTFDEINWTTIAPNLSESNHVGCTVMNGANGCYFWSLGAPSDNGSNGDPNDDKTFKIRITAKNISQISTFGTSNNVNSANLRLIAGNTNIGLNGSASSAIFPMTTAFEFVATETFVMSSKGELFYIDATRGLLYVSPSNGIQTLLIEKNSTFGVEDGELKDTKLKLPYKIGIDYQDNLYIYDYDRVRKIDTNAKPMSITTIIGKSPPANITATDITTKPAQALKLIPTTFLNAQKYEFHVLGNGDIWFTNENGSQVSQRKPIRFYNHIDSKIYTYNLGGVGNKGSALVELADVNTLILHFALSYDPNTFVISKMIASSSATGIGAGISSIRTDTFEAEAPHPTGTIYNYGYYDSTYTGLDGNIYFLDINMSAVLKYDHATNSFSRIYGSGVLGNCPTGTPAIDCNVNIGGIFVNKQGKLFVLDGGVIRTIDDNDNIQDVFGQSLSYGENTLATNARFKQISSLGVWYDADSLKTKVIVNDRYGYKIKEFDIGGDINSIAGSGLENGNPLKIVDSLTTNINTDGTNGKTNNLNMLVDSSNGEIYKGAGTSANYVLKRNVTISILNEDDEIIDKIINQWKDMITPGAAPFVNMDSDTLIGNPVSAGKVTFGNYTTTLFMGMSSNYVLMLDHDYDSGAKQHRGGAILLYNRTNKTIEKIAGKYGQPNSSFAFCSDGQLPTACVKYYGLQNVGSGYSQAFYDETLESWILAVTGTNKVRVLKKGVAMTTLVTLSENIRSMTYLRIGGLTPSKHKIWYCTTGGVLREYDLKTSTEKALNWTISNMSCESNYLAYSPQRNSLIFPILQNGLGGVAEYLLP